MSNNQNKNKKTIEQQENVADTSPLPVDSANGDNGENNESQNDDNVIDGNVGSDDADDANEDEDDIVIIEGGGSEYVIESETEEPMQAVPAETAPDCSRNKQKDKKLADYGTYISAAIFLAAILLSVFNMKGFKYPLSFLLMGFGGLSMGITAVLRLFNNRKCGCKVCMTQMKTFLWSALLWFLVFLAGLITFIVLTVTA